jgi:hypothetical protein
MAVEAGIIAPYLIAFADGELSSSDHPFKE